MSSEANLASLVDRLEKVTVRLEAAQGRLVSSGPVTSSGSSAAAPSAVPKAAAPIPGAPAASKAPSGDALGAYDTFLAASVAAFMKAATDVGGKVLRTSETLEAVMKGQRNIIAAFGQCQQPDAAGMQQLVAEVASHMGVAISKGDDRRSAIFNHNKTVAEAVQGMSWVLYSGPACGMSAPARHIEEAWNSAEFYANKLLMQYKNTDAGAAQVTWVRSLKEVFQKMKDYVSEYYPQGPVWNSSGIPLAQFKGGAAVAAPAAPSPPASAAAAPKPAARSAPPPPPPGPPPPPDMTPISDSAPPAPNMNALFSELTKGEAVTSGLRKVTDDMKTKNRTDRSSVVPVVKPVAAKAPAAKSGAAVGPPRFECEGGRKWMIENQVDNKKLVVEGTIQQSIYVYKCTGSVVQVKGKVNAISLDSCSKVGVVFENVVSSVEVVNSKSVEVQCIGSVPTFAIDKVDGCQLYLSTDCLGTEILTAKSSGINIVVPGATEDDEYVEHYVPEQFISRIVNGVMVTEPVVHSGA